MRSTLTEEEWAYLSSRFGLTAGSGSKQPSISSVTTGELLDLRQCEAYLDQWGAEIGSPSRRATASMLAKRYAFLLLAPALYAMSVWNKELQASAAHCVLELPNEGSASKFPNLVLKETFVSAPEAGKRKEWREETISKLFAGHFSLLLRTLSEAGHVPRAILWENAFVRIAPLYEDEIEEQRHPSVSERLHDDFQFIIRKASANLYGERRHPFSGFVPGGNRVTCCLYYEMAPEYCRACPKPLGSRA
ncbi:IucA/IucC family C-terminal-domain containing protein [Paenibacillus sp. GCM10027627]|uniref:IucA/IucC family C-terminal-domain containing protein n=1 Tax=unclassified Paenibacillus TaxID=185978 RepID=UPI0036415494